MLKNHSFFKGDDTVKNSNKNNENCKSFYVKRLVQLCLEKNVFKLLEWIKMAFSDINLCFFFFINFYH